jgi:hypothetical protein
MLYVCGCTYVYDSVISCNRSHFQAQFILLAVLPVPGPLLMDVAALKEKVVSTAAKIGRLESKLRRKRRLLLRLEGQLDAAERGVLREETHKRRRTLKHPSTSSQGSSSSSSSSSSTSKRSRSPVVKSAAPVEMAITAPHPPANPSGSGPTQMATAAPPPPAKPSASGPARGRGGSGQGGGRGRADLPVPVVDGVCWGCWRSWHGKRQGAPHSRKPGLCGAVRDVPVVEEIRAYLDRDAD